MRAFVVSSSPVDARILINVLTRQGLEVSRCTAGDDLSGTASEKRILFFDWENDKLTAEQKFGLYKGLSRDGERGVFLVGSRAHEREMLQACGDRREQLLFKPIQTEAVRQKILRLRRDSFAAMKLDVQVINAFIEATANTFETVVGLRPVREKVSLLDPCKPNGAMDVLCDISGVIGLSGDYLGSVAVSLPVRVALRAAASMVGERERSHLDGEVRDCIGEIVNIIAGQAKAALENTPYRFALAVPTVVVGKGHRIHIREDTPTLVLIFTLEGARFFMQVNIRPAESTVECEGVENTAEADAPFAAATTAEPTVGSS